MADLHERPVHDAGIEVTVRDVQTGETHTSVIHDDYVLITAGSCYRHHVMAYPKSGTHVVTLKGMREADRG